MVTWTYEGGIMNDECNSYVLRPRRTCLCCRLRAVMKRKNVIRHCITVSYAKMLIFAQ